MSAQAGILFFDARPVPYETVESLSLGNSALGPDRTGRYVTDGIAMLAFALHFDTYSSLEQQPVHTDSGAALTFDGRLDNRDELIVRFGGHNVTDAALLARALEHGEHEVLASVIGDWSLARWDAVRRRLTLARDYTGNRPLYYCAQANFFMWSTALEPFLAVCDRSVSISDEYMFRKLVFAPPNNLTPYSNVLSVPAGSIVTVRPGTSPSITLLPTLTSHETQSRDPRECADRFRQLLTEAVKVRLRAHRPVWTELSGGYDSSSITCLAHRLVAARSVEAPALQPVTVTMPLAATSDESRFVACVEQHCGLTSVRVRHADTFTLDTRESPHLGASVGGDDTDWPWTVAAKAGSQVLLSGELGDLLTMPVSIHDIMTEHLSHRHLGALLRDSVRHCRGQRTSLLHLWRTWVDTAVATRRSGVSSPEERLHSIAASPNDRSDTVLGLRRAWLSRFTMPNSLFQLVASSSPAKNKFADAFNHVVAAEAISSIRSTSAVRVTYPFSHRPLMQFILSTPATILWSHRHSRGFLSIALRDVLPPQIIARRSKATGAEVRNRVLLSAVKKEAGTVPRWEVVTRGYADAGALQSLFQSYAHGASQYQPILWRLFVVERLLRQLGRQRDLLSLHAEQLV